MDNFKTFLNFVKSQDDYYNQLLDDKHLANKFYKIKLKDEEFLCMFYINALINDKTPAHRIIKRIPKKYINLFKQTLDARFNAKQLVVEWSQVKAALENADKHNRKVYDYKYFEEHFPCRKRVKEIMF